MADNSCDKLAGHPAVLQWLNDDKRDLLDVRGLPAVFLSCSGASGGHPRVSRQPAVDILLRYKDCSRFLLDANGGWIIVGDYWMSSGCRGR